MICVTLDGANAVLLRATLRGFWSDELAQLQQLSTALEWAHMHPERVIEIWRRADENEGLQRSRHELEQQIRVSARHVRADVERLIGDVCVQCSPGGALLC